MRYALPFLCLLLGGCAGVGAIRLPGIAVKAPPMAGKPATIAKSDSGVTVPLPEGSRLVKTEFGPVAATEKTPARPAKTVTEIIPGAPTEYHETKATVDASSGTVDTSVAKHQIDAAERRWLLLAAIGCGILGLVAKSMLPAWPSLSNGLLIASPCAFAAWKFAEVPPWLWACVVVGVLLLIAGYKRAEWDANKDGIPDILQRPPAP